ncbi:hypothetical protein CASFOL_020666 [Castilleja foliolosa]|uniref:Uncharacterized protein n=1 Tax=Castilleja foliolosa TaxID=1961234 RepID=A0ABD3D2U2_9LAMI
MIMKNPSLFLTFICFFLILILIHEAYNFKFIQNTSRINGPSPLWFHQPLNTHRKALTTSAMFDFTPFVNKHHHRELQPESGPPGGGEIDPRYGAEKRLVPSGPNPLHH